MKTLAVGSMALALSIVLAALLAAKTVSVQPLPNGAIPESYYGETNLREGFAPRVTVQPDDVSDRLVRCIWRKGCSAVGEH